MFRLVRRLRRDERGQALVLGVVVMLVLAITVMMSVSIGNGVYEKIKLQDAADAQAYSLAVKEARAYNFVAYTNRAMIVHYSAMLTVMSYVSHAIYLDRTVGQMGDYLKYLPGVGSIFGAVSAATKAWKEAADLISTLVIPLLTSLNVALWLAQEAMLTSTLYDLYSANGRGHVIRGTDPRADVTPDMDRKQPFSKVPITSLFNDTSDLNYSNAKNFLHILDDGPHSSDATMGADPTGMLRRGKLTKANALTDPDMAKYRLLMGNLANGVRRTWTATGEGPFLLGRKWDVKICVVVGELRIEKTADSQIKSFDESFDGNRKDQLFASDTIKVELRPGCALLPWSTLFEQEFRAVADRRRGYHQEVGGSHTDDHHEWAGITPFITADPSYMDPWRNHFGYPCNMVTLGKDMGAERDRQITMTEAEARQKRPFEMRNLTRDSGHKGFMVKNIASSWVDGQGQEHDEVRFEDPDEEIHQGFLDMTWKYVGGRQDEYASDFRSGTGGMMAIAVGRAVYHRPGQWKEEPNFFNPLWTARLAPLRTHWDLDRLEWLVEPLGDGALLFNGLNY